MITKEINFSKHYEFQHHLDRLVKRGLSFLNLITNPNKRQLLGPHQLDLFCMMLEINRTHQLCMVAYLGHILMCDWLRGFNMDSATLDDMAMKIGQNVSHRFQEKCQRSVT